MSFSLNCVYGAREREKKGKIWKGEQNEKNERVRVWERRIKKKKKKSSQLQTINIYKLIVSMARVL